MAMMGRLYDRYGPIPRLLLNELRNLTSWGFKFDETLEEHEVRLAVKLAQFLERYTTMGPEDSIGMSGSHAVLIIVPICLGKVVNVSRSCYTTLASRHIGVELAMVAARKYREKGRLLFDDIAEVPQAHQERMFFWEGLAHYALERWLASPKAIINLGSKSPCLNFQWEQRPTSQKSVPTTLQDVALAWEGAHFHLNPISSVGVPHTEWAPGLVFSTNSYLRLERKSASTFDGIAITEESIQPTGSVDTIIGAQKILLFQMFREGGNNDVRTEGFQRLLSALPPRFQQASICLIWITRTTEYPSPQVLAAAHGILFPDKNVFKARTGSWQYMLRAPAVDKIWT
ncbi:hypothetical protein DFH27DRAFT_363694 [Peziza echinospora]|nr:hypothetical protein DFH27DRAFT_363694 [Peziza echinospora]